MPQSHPESQSPIFADYARYYDLLYRDKDYAAAAEYVAGLIRKFHPSARSILELGSGTGIHAGLLAGKASRCMASSAALKCLPDLWPWLKT